MTLSDNEIKQIIDEFLNMTTERQYIGARYVPIFGRKNEDSILWDNTAPYEPLTIVLYQGNSYTSRQYVPIGVNITNQEFWANTGNYNAQIEQYRQETQRVQEELDMLEFYSIKPFDTVDDMVNDDDLQIGMICHTNGFHAAGDAGAAFYKITASGTANDMDVIACGDKFANLVITESYVTPEMFGAVGDGVHDDSDNLIRMFEQCKNVKAEKTYLVTKTISIFSNTVFNLLGTIVNRCTDINKGCLNIENSENVFIFGGTIRGTGATTTSPDAKSVIKFYNSSNVTVKNVSFFDIANLYVILFESSNNCYADGNIIDEYSYSGIVALNKCDNVYVLNNTLTNLVNNTADNTYPISLSAFSYEITTSPEVGNNLNAVGNYIDNGSNPWWEGIDAHGGKNINIADNTVVNCYTGIAVVTLNHLFPSDNIIISNNRCIMPISGSARSVNNTGIVASGENIIVDNNIIENSGMIGTVANANCGIMIPDPIDKNCNINNNIIKNAAHNGIRIHGYDITCENNFVSFADKPIGATYNNFAIRMDINTHEAIIKNNVFKKHDYLSTGIAANSGDYTYRVIFVGNEYDNNDLSYRAWIVPQKQEYIPSSIGIKAGRTGDVVMKLTPGSGQPIGWICTASATSSTDSVWAPLANLQ